MSKATMIDEQKAMREEIAELRGQVIAWQKQCDTLTHQVLCCGVAASHPDATLTTRGAYAGKWNSAQAEEVRKLRAECDQMREERTAWRVTAENAENAEKDAARLDWMIFHSASLNHGNDGEYCRVVWRDHEFGEQATRLFGDGREAIDAAMKETP